MHLDFFFFLRFNCVHLDLAWDSYITTTLGTLKRCKFMTSKHSSQALQNQQFKYWQQAHCTTRRRPVSKREKKKRKDFLASYLKLGKRKKKKTVFVVLTDFHFGVTLLFLNKKKNIYVAFTLAPSLLINMALSLAPHLLTISVPLGTHSHYNDEPNILDSLTWSLFEN